MAVVVYFSNERSGPTIPGRTNQRTELVIYFIFFFVLSPKHMVDAAEAKLCFKIDLSPIIFEASAKISPDTVATPYASPR